MKKAKYFTLALILWLVQLGAKDTLIEISGSNNDFTIKLLGWYDSIKRNKAVDFGNWLHHNWYIPAKEGWELDVDNEEYTLSIPDVNYFTTQELFEKFQNKEGEF